MLVEGVRGSTADEHGWLPIHHFCSPARPELLQYYLKHAHPSSVCEVVNTENHQHSSAVGLLVQGSSVAQQHCLAQLLQVG
ncbi:MAG: hypothetical protein SGPRY_011370 [Prymnesium sp.]